jgi:hypothetical protein
MRTARFLHVRFSLLVVSAGAGLLACRGDIKPQNGVDPNAAIVEIIASPAATTIGVNQFATHQVVGVNVDGDTVRPLILWSSSGGTLFTTTGTFSSSQAGVFDLVARARDFPNIMDTVTVTVTAPPTNLVDIIIDPVSPVLAPGETRPFHAAAVLSDSSVVTGAAVNWSATGGTIDAAGNYTAGLNTGSFQVVATSQTDPIADTVAVNINIVAPVVQDVVLAPDTISLRPGDTTTFRAFATYSDGTFAPASVTYTASAGNITANGFYTAGQVPGSFRVIALNLASGIADTSDVTVIASSLVYITITPGTAALTTGSQQTFSVEGTFSDSSTAVVSVNFTATGGTITAGGLYNAGSVPGPYTVVAETPNGLFADTATVTINSASATLTSIIVSPATASLLVGGTQQFNVVGRLSDGTQVGVAVNWTASGGSVNTNGRFTAPQVAGTYRVVATTTTGGLADTSLVTVNPAVTLTKINVTPPTTSLLTGAIQQFTATGQLSNGGSSAVSVNWSATGGSINSSGQYTAGNTPGTFRAIAVQQGGTLADTSVITINNLPPPGSNQCTNEPSGHTVLFDAPWNAVPPVTPNTDAFGWSVRSVFEATNKLSIFSDAAAPRSPNNTIAGKFPQGSAGGSAPFRLNRGFGRNTTAIYFCIFTKLDPQFTNNGNTGTKFGFFITPYAGQAGAPNHYFNLTTNLGINLQNNGAQLNRNMQSSFSLVNNRGIWVKVEFLVVGNTGGNADGIARMWVNGSQVLNVNNVQYFLPQHPAAFNGITWNPTYGGGPNPVPYDMFQFVDHWYLSIK